MRSYFIQKIMWQKGSHSRYDRLFILSSLFLSAARLKCWCGERGLRWYGSRAFLCREDPFVHEQDFCARERGSVVVHAGYLPLPPSLCVRDTKIEYTESWRGLHLLAVKYFRCWSHFLKSKIISVTRRPVGVMLPDAARWHRVALWRAKLLWTIGKFGCFVPN